MERYIFRLTGIIALVGTIIFGFAALSYAQYTPEQEARLNAMVDSTARAAANLPAHEKKISSFILQRINRMIQEQAKRHPNPEEKYSIRGMRVDKSARVLLNVALPRGSAKADTNAVVAKIREFGGTVKTVSNPMSDYPIEIYCWLPYDTVKAIARLPKVANISGIGVWTTRTGSVTSIGDSQLLADQARTYFDVDGSGIKVGVISDGIEHANDSKLTGDLPPYIETVNGNYPGDEGTAMMEIVYDMAPGITELAFGGIGPNDGPNDMANRIAHLYQSFGCKIVVDDIGWYSGVPYFSESSLMELIQFRISNNDKTYISAAGNDGESCWTGYSMVDGENWNAFWYQGSSFHIDNPIELGPYETVRIFLQWADPWGASSHNFDLYLFDASGTQVAVDNTVQDGDDNPEESINFTNGGSYATYFVRVKKMYTGDERELMLLVDQPHKLGYTYPNYADETMPVRQIYGHSASLGAISVAAYSSDQPTVLAEYSSRGKTPIYVFTGQTYDRTERFTPTITATAKVSTKVGQDGYFIEPFEGTSAAAPHIAGIAALYFSKYPSDSHTAFYNALKAHASTLGEIGTGGVHNTQSGYGKANAFAALAKGTFLPVAISQVDAQSQPFGQVGVYEGGAFVNYTVPKTFSWLENSSQTLRADQNFKPGTTQKYRDWNQLSDVVNHRAFMIAPATQELTAHFLNATNATIQAQLLDGGSPGGNVQFNDPWLIDDTSDPKGLRNRSLNAIWYNQASPFSPSTESSHNGVFLNESDPTFPRYSVRVPETQSINGVVSYFFRWTTPGANITQPNNLVGGYYESPVVFESADATVTAEYKGHMVAATATGFSNGRRIGKDTNGVLHFVYESAGEVFYTTSSDNGNIWSTEQLISNGAGLSYYPSLAVVDNYVYAVWAYQEMVDFWTLKFRRRILTGAWDAVEGVGGGSGIIFPVNPAIIPKPVITTITSPTRTAILYDRDGGTFSPNGISIINGFFRNADGSWTDTDLDFSGKNPSICANIQGAYFFDFGMSYDQNGVVYFKRWNPDTQSWQTTEAISPDLWWLSGCKKSNLSYYYDTAHLVWEGWDNIAEIQMIYYRSRNAQGQLGAATALPSHGDDVVNPTIASYQTSPVRVFYELGGEVVKVVQSSPGWLETNYAAGQYPSVVPHGQSGAVWAKQSGALYTLESDYSGGLLKSTGTDTLPAEQPLAVVKRFDFSFSREGKTGYLTLELQGAFLGDEAIAFDDSLVSQEVKLSPGMNRLTCDWVVRFHDYEGQEDSVAELLNISLNVGEVRHRLKSLRLAALSDLNDDRNHLWTEQILLPAIAGQAGRLSIGWDNAKPVITNILVKAPVTGAGKQAQNPAQPVSLPSRFALAQNYPNPFNPTTIIRFDLPEAGEVDLRIFNSLGERVKTLASGKCPAGAHTVTWNGRNDGGEPVGSGVYFLKINAAGFQATRKMVLIR